MTQVATNVENEGKEKDQNVTNEATQQANASAAPKKRKRGITNETRSVSRLKFHERDCAANGLFLTNFRSIEVGWATIGQETQGLPSYNGEAVPRLSITVVSAKENDDNSKRWYNHSFLLPESTPATIPGGVDEWKVTSIFSFMKHVLEVLVLKGKLMTEEMEDMLTLPFEDYEEDELGNCTYKEIPVSEVIQGWRVVFENFVKICNTAADGKPAFLKADGKPKVYWTKMIRCQKRKNKSTKALEWYNINNGELAIPSFVGEGVFEEYKQGVEPNIKLDTSKESITPKEISKAKAPNFAAPGLPGAPMMGGAPGMPMMGGSEDMGMGGFNPAFDAANAAKSAGSDLPF